jgi:hypothetical protein
MPDAGDKPCFIVVFKYAILTIIDEIKLKQLKLFHWNVKS